MLGGLATSRAWEDISMTAVRILSLATSPLALIATSAAAQETIAYETGEYEYAQSEVAVEQVQEEAPVIFQPRPVIQSLPSVDPEEDLQQAATVTHEAHVEERTALVETTKEPRILYAYPAVYMQPPVSGSASRVIYHRQGQAPSAGYTYVYQGSSPMVPAGGRIVSFDREAWLAECRRRIAPVTYYEEDGRGEVVGAAIGAVAGGLLGNRIAGRGNRTVGTIAGAGLGAAAGMAIGDTMDDRVVAVEGEDDGGQCEAYLDGYMESARTGGLHGQYSSTGEYMLVPVTVMVPQRAIYADGTPVKR